MSRRDAVCRAVVLAAATAAAVMTTVHRTRAQVAVADVEWTNLVQATAAGSEIRKAAGCSSCADAGGTSRQAIASGDGYAEFTPVLGARLYAGLGANATASTDPAQIDFAFSFWADGGWDIRERNVYRTEGRFAAGDVFRVAVEAGVVRYYRNGSLVYTSTVAATLPLVLDTSLIGAGASLASAAVAAQAAPPVQNPVAITTTAAPAGAVNQAYAASLAATGGSGTYRWTLAAGALPPGLRIGETGVIDGTPTAAGTFAFTVRATDAGDAANFAEQPLTITVAALANAVVVGTTSLPPARVGDAYSAALSASGGSGTLVWTLAGGSLPNGLTLEAGGAIRGTATVGGRYAFTVRATDAANAANSDDQPLTLSVLAATPPSTYDAISDRTPRAKGTLPQLGPAGHMFTDPVFGSRMMRVTDGATRPGAPDRSFHTPSATHTNVWSADGLHFYVTSNGGTRIPYAFDAATMTARRLNPTTTGDGGLTLRFFNEPTFSYTMPGVLYGTYSGAGANLRSVDQYDLETGVYSQLLNLDSLVPNLANTYTGGLAASAGPAERLFAFFGGTSQDRHYYLVVFEKDNPSKRLLVNTTASTVDGVPTNITLNFLIHAAAIDRTGRYVTIYPTSADLQAPRSAAPAYIWDTLTNTFTETPLVSARAGGHDAYGYGQRINKGCCTTTTWDAGQWQFRSLATPLTTYDLITPVLQPKEIYLSDHPSWHNAQPVAMVPFLSGTYRFGDNTTEWRAWDDEIIAIQTEAPGTGATVWRFAHHRSNVNNDSDPSRISFWYTPRVNISPDGRWALFTSNWEKTLGIDPQGDVGGAFRRDAFLVELKRADDPAPSPEPASAPVIITTTTLPDGKRKVDYTAAVSSSGGRAPFTWSIAAGTLPPGLALDPSTGTISGTPKDDGTWSFTVRVVDSASPATSHSAALSITIVRPPKTPTGLRIVGR